MKQVQLETKVLKGISTRTANKNEMSPDTAKIGALWQTFDQTVSVDYKNGERVYGVYTDYESDMDGEFTVLAAYDGKASGTDNLEKVTIEAGKYLCFEAVAQTEDDAGRAQAIIQTWGEVWQYFSHEPDYKRAYTTDFEFYNGPAKIEIYIAIL